MANPFDRFDDASGNPFDQFDAGGEAPAQPTGAVGTGNPLTNFWNDYAQRQEQARQMMGAVNEKTTTTDPLEAGLEGIREGLNAAGGVGAMLWSLPGALINQISRPVAMVSEAAGAPVDPNTITDVASMALPLVGELAAARNVANAAKIAGLSIPAYERAAALGLAARNAEAARVAAAAKASKPPGVVETALAPFAARVSQGAAEKQAGEQLAAIPKPGGDPVEVTRAFRQQLDDIDASTQAAVDQATETARAKTEAVGGETTPEASGAALRDTITEAQTASQQASKALYDAVDPDGMVTGNTIPTRNAAAEIMADEPPTAAPMDAAESAIFKTAAEIPAVSPLRDILALRSRVSTAMREELRAAGSTPKYARLTRLRGAIQANLDHTIADRVAADDAAVASGKLAPEETVSAKLQAEIDAQRQATEARAATGGITAPTAGGPAPAVPGAAGAEIPGAGGSGNVAGDQGVSGGIAQPTADAAVTGRLKAATEGYKAQQRTFGLGPVRDILRTVGERAVFRLPDGSVPAKFFKPGKGQFDAMQAAIKAGGDRALQVLEDYAAMTLRRAADPGGTGVLDPKKFAAWKAAHQDALRALPEATRARFADAAKAGQAVQEAAASRAAALQEANSSAAGKLVGLTEREDITRAIGAVFGKTDSVAQMRQLASAARKGGPAAVAGLRQAVADHIAQLFVDSKGDAFQGFVRKNSGALKVVLTDEELAKLHGLAANAVKGNQSILRGVLDVVAGLGGELIAGHVGGGIGLLTAETLQMIRSQGIARVQDLVSRAIREPELMKALSAKVPDAKPGTPAFQTGMKVRNRAVIAALAASQAGSDRQD